MTKRVLKMNEELRLKLKQYVNELCKKDNVCAQIRGLALYSIDRLDPQSLIKQAKEWGIE